MDQYHQLNDLGMHRANQNYGPGWHNPGGGQHRNNYHGDRHWHKQDTCNVYDRQPYTSLDKSRMRNDADNNPDRVWRNDDRHVNTRSYQTGAENVVRDSERNNWRNDDRHVNTRSYQAGAENVVRDSERNNLTTTSANEVAMDSFQSNKKEPEVRQEQDSDHQIEVHQKRVDSEGAPQKKKGKCLHTRKRKCWCCFSCLCCLVPIVLVALVYIDPFLFVDPPPLNIREIEVEIHEDATLKDLSVLFKAKIQAENPAPVGVTVKDMNMSLSVVSVNGRKRNENLIGDTAVPTLEIQGGGHQQVAVAGVMKVENSVVVPFFREFWKTCVRVVPAVPPLAIDSSAKLTVAADVSGYFLLFDKIAVPLPRIQLDQQIPCTQLVSTTQNNLPTILAGIPKLIGNSLKQAG